MQPRFRGWGMLSDTMRWRTSDSLRQQKEEKTQKEVCIAFRFVCICSSTCRDVFPWDTSIRHLPSFHLHWNKTLCAKPISHVPHQQRRNDSVGPSNLQIPSTTQTHTKAYSSWVFTPLPPTKLLLVWERNGCAGKSVWRSIRQFPDRSAADTQLIYSEGARTGVLVDILLRLPNVSLSLSQKERLIMTNCFLRDVIHS